MKYPERILLLHFLLITQLGSAQVADNVNYYFSRITGASSVNEKLAFNDSIANSLLEYLESVDDITGTAIRGVKYLGQISSADSIIKIFTWNIPVAGGNNLYNCIIYNKTLDRKYLMVGEEGLQGVEEGETIDNSNWYGSLYYDIQPVGQGEDISYILLGYDPDNINMNSKVIEVLHFNNEGEPVFGRKIIRAGDKDLNRMIFKYSPLATMMLRFNDDRNRIIFDHLSPSSEQFEGLYKYYGPDFSYDALELKEGKLVLVEAIDLRKSDEGNDKLRD